MTQTKKVLKLFLPLAILAGLGYAWLHKWDLYDAWKLRNYTPPAQIVQIANATTMKDSAKRLFYVYHPELNDKSTFNMRCSNGERTIVLGCYVSGRGIYLYNVTEPRLQGIVEVTSAHELLHAAYERLDGSDKKQVSDMLNRHFDTVTDPRIRKNIEDYRNNGADITNELHSILGTEIRNLSPELDTYYAKYFSNRLKVVEFSEKYEQAFTARKQQVAAADQKLQQLKGDIEEAQAGLAALKSTLDVQRQQLDGFLAAQQIEAYNNGVPQFNSQVNRFNGQVRYISSLIDQYNALVAERNAIAVEEGELVKAIDSRPSTIDGQ